MYGHLQVWIMTFHLISIFFSFHILKFNFHRESFFGGFDEIIAHTHLMNGTLQLSRDTTTKPFAHITPTVFVFVFCSFVAVISQNWKFFPQINTNTHYGYFLETLNCHATSIKTLCQNKFTNNNKYKSTQLMRRSRNIFFSFLLVHRLNCYKWSAYPRNNRFSLNNIVIKFPFRLLVCDYSHLVFVSFNISFLSLYAHTANSFEHITLWNCLFSLKKHNKTIQLLFFATFENGITN